MNTTASSLTGNEHNNYLVGNNGNDTLDGVALTASKFQLGTAANDSGDRIVYDQSSGKLYYDADGTGTTAAIQFATLSNKPGLVAADFLVVA